MKERKVVSLVLAIMMFANIFGISITASAQMTNSNLLRADENKANISFVYLGKGTTPAATAQELPSTGLVKDDVFWIGIQLSNMDKLSDVFYTNKSDKTKSGLHDITAGLLYDSRYVAPKTGKGYAATNLFRHCSSAYPVDSNSASNDPNMCYLDDGSALYTVANYNAEGALGIGTAAAAEPLELDNTSGTVKSFSYSTMLDSSSAWYSDTEYKNDVLRVFQDGVGLYKDVAHVDNRPVILEVFPFVVTGDNIPKGAKAIQAGLGNNILVMGRGLEGADTDGFQWINEFNDSDYMVNLKNYFKITDKDGEDVTSNIIDIFPASASDYLDSIAVSGTLTKLLGSYIEGNKFEPAGITVTPHKTEGGNQTAIEPTNDDFKGLKFYVDDADKTAATLSTTRELTTTTGLATTDNNKHVYVSYTLDNKTAIADLGAITVAAKSVSSVTNQTTGDNKTTFGTASAYYTGTAIKDILTGTSAEKLTVVKTYNNGYTKEVVYSEFGTNGLALYYVDAAGNLQLVGDQTKLAEGTNTFYVAETGKENTAVAGVTIKAGPYTINAVTDTMILKTATATANDLTYTEDTTGTHTINFANVLIGYNMSSAPTATPTTKKVSEIGSSKLIFYIGTSNVPADNMYTSGTTIDGTEYDANTMAGENKYVYVVPADDTAATPVRVGQLKNRAISTSTTDIGNGYTVTGISTDANTQYGAKLGNGAKINVKYDNGNTKELSYSDFATEGITMKIVKADGTTVVVDSATDQTVLTPAMNGGFVQFFYNGTKIGTSTPLTVNKKTVGYSSNANLETPSVTKEYDGTTKLAEADEAKVAFKINESDLVDDDLKGGKLEITGVTYSYNSKNVAEANAIVASETSQDSLDVKPSTNGSTDDVTKFNANYTLAPLTANTTVYDRASITAKTLNVTSITGVPPVVVGADETARTGNSSLALTNTNSNIVAGDNVALTYTYTYTASSVDGAGNPTDVAISNTGLTGTNSDNYTLTGGTIPTTGTGTVENKKLNGISVKENPTNVTYTYPNTELDLTGLKVKIDYDGAQTETVWELSKFFNEGGQISVTDASNVTKTLTKDNYTTEKVNLKVGAETTLNITYSGKNTTTKVTTNKKPIKLSEITFAASKVYGQDDAAATKTATPPTGAIEAADADAVQFTFDAKFADESAGENKNVTISNVKLVKKGEGTTDPSVNYVIVKDNGDPIAETDTTTIDTGVISQGAQAAPATPTISVDPATNNIIVEGPLGENIEYSIDGGQTWQSDVTFTGLTKGTNYTVQARVKATADGNYAPSEPTASEPVTTFKYYVAVYKKNAKEGSEPAYEVYTNTTSAASKADLNALLPKKISNLKEFYTDAPATIKVEYPYTLAAENVLYYTTSGGGGGGAASSVTITLDKTSVSGEVGNSEKVTATIKGSTATPKWTSSNEKVATVDQNGNITFVGEGKATVKINVSGTVKSVAVTVTAAKATPVPTVEPTVEPTDKPSEPDKPIIDVNYTKPYASGYEDDTFRPENKITRAELAAMIARLSYGDDLPDGAYVSSFPDIEADAWFNKYVGYLEDKNVLNGYEDGTFRPYDTVTRGEISTVIARAQRYELIPYSGIFADVTDSDWAKDYIQTLASQGIISGYEDGTFGPYSPLSRAEAVTIINNVLAPSTPIVTFTPNDIAGHWAEANIILAVNERMLGGTWSEDLNPVEIPTPEVTEPAEEEAPAPEATEAPAEEVVPEGELDPTVKDEPVVPVNPEA